jgi:hypothetical protein
VHRYHRPKLSILSANSVVPASLRKFVAPAETVSGRANALVKLLHGCPDDDISIIRRLKSAPGRGAGGLTGAFILKSTFIWGTRVRSLSPWARSLMLKLPARAGSTHVMQLRSIRIEKAL